MIRRAGPLLALALALGGCGPVPRPARLSDAEPERPRERQARHRVEHPQCNLAWGLLVPGMAQTCLGQTAEGAAITSLAATEGVGLVAGAVTKKSGLTYATAVGLQDLYLYGVSASVLQGQLANHLRYTPEDTTAELLFAPFNGNVMKRPEVWGGILGMTAVGMAASMLLMDRGRVYHPGARPVLFGSEVPPAFGYPAAGLAFAGLFSHVAPTEEAFFRGVVQSGLARNCGEGCGWALGSFIFGVAHAPNALLLDSGKDRARYLALAVPYLVMAGQYLGWVYRHDGYSLAPSTAIHFWYDLLVSAVDFALDPKGSPLAAKVTFGF